MLYFCCSFQFAWHVYMWLEFTSQTIKNCNCRMNYYFRICIWAELNWGWIHKTPNQAPVAGWQSAVCPWTNSPSDLSFSLYKWVWFKKPASTDDWRAHLHQPQLSRTQPGNKQVLWATKIAISNARQSPCVFTQGEAHAHCRAYLPRVFKISLIICFPSPQQVEGVGKVDVTARRSQRKELLSRLISVRPAWVEQLTSVPVVSFAGGVWPRAWLQVFHFCQGAKRTSIVFVIVSEMDCLVPGLQKLIRMGFPNAFYYGKKNVYLKSSMTGKCRVHGHFHARRWTAQ